MRYSVLLATCAVLAAMPSVAHANLILFNPAVYPDQATPSQATATITGLPALPSILTMSGSGRLAAVNVPSGNPPGSTATVTAGSLSNQGANPGPNSPTVGSLGWDNAVDVGIGLSLNQGGNAPLTLSALTLTLFTPTAPFTPVGDFKITGPIQFSSSDVAGAGNQNPFNFVLSRDEQIPYNNLLDEFGDGLRVGVSFDVGCPSPIVVTGCNPSTGGGIKTVKAFDQSISNLGTPPAISLPASFPLFATGLVGIGLLGWRRKRKSTTSVLAAY